MTKKDTAWVEEFLPMLPETPPENVLNNQQIYEDLGAKLIIFNRESVTVEPDMYDYMLPTAHLGGHRKWGSFCKCSECGETFSAGWGGKSMILMMGEDGCTYPGYTEEGFEDSVEYKEGEEVICPMCGETCTAMMRSSIKKGRAIRTQIAGIQNINGITVITYWIVERYLTATGYSKVTFLPREAIAISPYGTLIRFTHVKHYMKNETIEKNWKMALTVRDPEEIKFNAGGSMYNYVFGSYYTENTPPMNGTTGEKTGIEDAWGYLYPVSYLKLWKAFPAVENLVRTGTAGIVMDAIKGHSLNNEDRLKEFNTAEVKPNRILGISKEDYAVVASFDWGLATLKLYKEYKKLRPKENAETFQDYIDDIGEDYVKMLMPDWNLGLGKICRYLQKQEEMDGMTQRIAWMFRDYQQMLHEIHIHADLGEPAPEEIFPPNLRRAHDRLTEQQNQILKEKEQEELKQRDGKFLQIKERMHPLEWTDGTFIIVIPEKPADLVREGNTLHHCVGGYSKQHVSGNPIFFVRHYRRPERSWYTLNEDLTGEKPHRIQLHGYKNEIVGRKHLRIPKQVETFVQTWEREVLAPWYRNNKKEIAI